ASLSAQLTDAVNGASFNGTNILNGTLSNTTTTSFVSGFDASASGGSITTIGFQAQALTGASTSATTVEQPAITDSATIASLAGVAANSTTAASYGNDV